MKCQYKEGTDLLFIADNL